MAIVGDAPLVCDPILPSGIPEGLSLGDHERQRAFLFALPREVEAPEVVGMRIAVRVEGLCTPELSEGQGRSTKVPIKAAPIPMTAASANSCRARRRDDGGR